MPRSHDTRLRVVTLTDVLEESGGAEKLAVEILCRLDPERYDRTYAVSRWTPASSEDPAYQAAAARIFGSGARLFTLKRGSPAALWQWIPLFRMLRRERIDVLHAHMFGSNLWGTIVARLAGVPVIVAHEHTWSYDGQPLRRFLDRAVIARFSSAFVAVSRDDRRKMIEVEGIDPADIVFIPNGIDGRARAAGSDVRAELGIPPDVPVIGSVSNLRPQKALTVMIEAFGKLEPEFPGLRLLIAGRGPERDTVLRRCAELGVQENVHLLGPRPDVPDVLAAIDVAVMSSDFEGSPLSVMEYMEAGLPVVATAVGGVPDLIDDGVHGLLVPTRDAGALAEAVGTLLRDPGLRAEMGERGRARQLAEFDIEVTVARVSELYVELLAQTSR